MRSINRTSLVLILARVKLDAYIDLEEEMVRSATRTSSVLQDLRRIQTLTPFGPF